MIHDDPYAVFSNAALNFVLFAVVLFVISLVLTQIKHSKLDHGSLKASWIRCKGVIQMLIIPFVFSCFH